MHAAVHPASTLRQCIIPSRRRRKSPPFAGSLLKLMSHAALVAALLPISPALAQQATTPAGTSEADGGTADASGAKPTPGDAKTAHPDTDQAIVVTGVK